jgi:hypothetical protein
LEHELTERRLAQRYELCLPLSAFEKHAGGRLIGSTRNVSTSGVYFVLDAPACFLGEFNLIITFPGVVNSDVSLHAIARIVRVDEHGSRIGVAAIVSRCEIHNIQ